MELLEMFSGDVKTRSMTCHGREYLTSFVVDNKNIC